MNTENETKHFEHTDMLYAISYAIAELVKLAEDKQNTGVRFAAVGLIQKLEYEQEKVEKRIKKEGRNKGFSLS